MLPILVSLARIGALAHLESASLVSLVDLIILASLVNIGRQPILVILPTLHRE